MEHDNKKSNAKFLGPVQLPSAIMHQIEGQYQSKYALIASLIKSLQEIVQTNDIFDCKKIAMSAIKNAEDSLQDSKQN